MQVWTSIYTCQHCHLLLPLAQRYLRNSKGGGKVALQTCTVTHVLFDVNKGEVNTEPPKGWRLLRVNLRIYTAGHMLPAQAGTPTVYSETTK